MLFRALLSRLAEEKVVRQAAAEVLPEDFLHNSLHTPVKQKLGHSVAAEVPARGLWASRERSHE
jgi:hypothetical protein